MKKGGASSQPPSPGNTPLSEDQVKIVLGEDADVVVDGRPFQPSSLKDTNAATDESEESSSSEGWGSVPPPPPLAKKRKRDEMAGGNGNGSGNGEETTWIVRTGMWRLRVQNARSGKAGGVECILVAVKLDCFSSEMGRNQRRGFLSG